jgi:hypothetical protein
MKFSKDDNQLEKVREHLENKLKECSAKSLCELKPEKNTNVAFKIQLIDQKMKPIKC